MTNSCFLRGITWIYHSVAYFRRLLFNWSWTHRWRIAINIDTAVEHIDRRSYCKIILMLNLVEKSKRKIQQNSRIVRCNNHVESETLQLMITVFNCVWYDSLLVFINTIVWIQISSLCTIFFNVFTGHFCAEWLVNCLFEVCDNGFETIFFFHDITHYMNNRGRFFKPSRRSSISYDGQVNMTRIL